MRIGWQPSSVEALTGTSQERSATVREVIPAFVSSEAGVPVRVPFARSIAWRLDRRERATGGEGSVVGRVAQGDNPAEERQLDHKAITVKELCTLYVNDLNAGLILGKGGRPKKPTTVVTDTGRIERHIIPLLGTRRVKDLTGPTSTRS